MTFIQAIQSGFSNYVNFSSRAIRSEYWFWVLFAVIGEAVGSGLDYTIFATSTGLFYSVFALAVFLPSLAVAIRRLHDLDRSGWWILISLIPIVGGIVLIVWFCSPGTPGPNRFGPDPLNGDGQISPSPAV
jgi:uncharacterized membrane protein YhaH (DUF805 family)